METQALLSRAESIEAASRAHLARGLSVRKQHELDFHDRDRDAVVAASLTEAERHQVYGNRKYYTATSRSREYVDNWIRQVAPGKVFLDYACGNGKNAILAAKAGAALSVGLDISTVSVENARREAANQAVNDTTWFLQADAEQTMLPDASVDNVICSGMLHHLDLSYAFPELRRVLKPGGSVLAVEALDYNPAIKLYRRLTPKMRTEWEAKHILSLKDIEFASRFFEVRSVRFWHITSIIAPHFRVMWALPALDRLDDLLTRVPGVRLMSWMFTFELVRRDDSV